MFQMGLWFSNRSRLVFNTLYERKMLSTLFLNKKEKGGKYQTQSADICKL